jgi:hypothetical protein
MFFQKLGILLARLQQDQCNAHTFFSSYSPSTSTSDAKMRVVDLQVARYVIAADQLSTTTMFLVRNGMHFHTAQ